MRRSRCFTSGEPCADSRLEEGRPVPSTDVGNRVRQVAKIASSTAVVSWSQRHQPAPAHARRRAIEFSPPARRSCTGLDASASAFWERTIVFGGDELDDCQPKADFTGARSWPAGSGRDGVGEAIEGRFRVVLGEVRQEAVWAPDVVSSLTGPGQRRSRPGLELLDAGSHLLRGWQAGRRRLGCRPLRSSFGGVEHVLHRTPPSGGGVPLLSRADPATRRCSEGLSTTSARIWASIPSRATIEAAARRYVFSLTPASAARWR